MNPDNLPSHGLWGDGYLFNKYYGRGFFETTQERSTCHRANEIATNRNRARKQRRKMRKHNRRSRKMNRA